MGSKLGLSSFSFVLVFGAASVPAQESLTRAKSIGGGLAWLAANQRSDGSWDGSGSDITASSFAMLAMLASGSTPTAGRYAARLRSGLRWLAGQRSRHGWFVDPLSGYGAFEHALATQVLVEAAKSVPEHRTTAQSAVWKLTSTTNSDGGWGFVAWESHTSVVAVVVRALVTARESGLNVPENALATARGFLERARDSKTAMVYGHPNSRAQLPHWLPATSRLATNASWLEAMVLLGRGDKELSGVRDAVAAQTPVWREGAQDPYGWSVAARAIARGKDNAWSGWMKSLEAALVPNQQLRGPLVGSWDPPRRTEPHLDRVRTTALALLGLQTAPRPIVQEAVRETIGGVFGGRTTGRSRLGRKGGRQIANSVHLGLKWLAAHQDDDGKWDCDEFMKHDPADDRTTGPGQATNDVGATALALLAFLGDGSTMRSGPYSKVVRKGISWLRSQQGESGLIGSKAGRTFMYNHALATLAVVEAYGLSQLKTLRRHAQLAVDFIAKARNPYKVWRYYPHDGDNDSSVTGWMVFALCSANDFGLKVDRGIFKYAEAWFEEVTDPNTGRCGYTKRGEGSSRELGTVARFPPSKTEALTALGLLCRIFLGQKPESHPVLGLAADRLAARPPSWKGDGSIDLYYWYWGAYAMYQMGGKYWKLWRKHLESTLLQRQQTNGSAAGSWDPQGAWGQSGGRVYATALGVLSLEVFYRYGRVVGR